MITTDAEIVIEYKYGEIMQHLHAVMSEIGGISKDKSGKGIPYKFRGIDQVYQTLQPLLIKHLIIVLPTKTKSVEYLEVETKTGGALNYCRLVQVYTFFSATDDSWVRAELPGEAMDSSDKSTSKALSAAFKYLAFQGFCIPVDDPNQDADATVHELKPRSQYSGGSQITSKPAENGLPDCPVCGKPLRRDKFNAQKLYCWKSSTNGGCGYDSTRDEPEGGEDTPKPASSNAASSKETAGKPAATTEDKHKDPKDALAASQTANANVEESKDVLTASPSEEAWAELKRMGLENSWPEHYMRTVIEARKRKGLKPAEIFEEVWEKWKVKNTSAVEDGT